MKFASSTVLFISVSSPVSRPDAFRYLFRMYRSAYGRRAKIPTEESLTPNERRLVDLLVARFQEGPDHSPIVVECGNKDFVFARCFGYTRLIDIGSSPLVEGTSRGTSVPFSGRET